MSPVPVVQQPNLADKGNSDEGVNLKDFVVVPSQESPSGSTSESHENEDLDCYSDAQLKALLDEAITYKTPKEVVTDKDAKESAEQPQEEEQQENKDPEPKGKKEPVKVDEKNDPPKNPFIPGSWGPSFRTIDPKSFAGPRDYSFCPRSTHTFGMPGMCCYSPAPNVPEVVKVRKERNAIIRNSHEIDGYRGSDNIDSLVRFIESSDSEPDHKKGNKKPVKNSGSKKAKKAPQQPKLPKPKPKEIVVQKTVEKPPERMPEIQTSDDISGKVSPTIEGSEFRVVMKKKKKPKN